MPPRLPLFQCLRTQGNVTCTATRSFAASAAAQASTKTHKRRGHDPYAVAQARARKAANLSRQEVLKQERAATLGDPVRGTTTPFVESFDDPLAAQKADQAREEHLNFLLTKSEVDRSIDDSKWLATPPASHLNMNNNVMFDLTPEDRQRQLAEGEATAEEALRRISSLALGSSKDRLRVNIQRCIDTFGRHETDKLLPPLHQALDQHQSRPQPVRDVAGNETGELQPVRAGPDTGSSEVQIAILTAKIRTLADFLETRGTTDKVNKRNLRLLVHRRAKLLQYLRRKEKAGPRWQRCIETLGLTEGTWKGEISL
ncbi:Ribosomal S15 [Teratosphaeria destructans]|uniref:Ribosomal S15 n=1 Tax=Teratosphaeria destructans TaxID=418781 RepID=A0A9W7W525_9PEZI|nr:Ribosomal S15 [Teratosphaeria destructans]